MPELYFPKFFGIRRISPGILVSLFILVLCSINPAQSQRQTSPDSQSLERRLDQQSQEQAADVVRIRTDLVQTSVAVLDKQGKPVSNLRPEDFDLRIDGKPYQFQFFDRVVNGVADESLKANNRRDGANIASSITSATAADATRTVLFFVDDLHLSAESIERTRNMLSHYIEQEMQEDDEAVIASATGQIGFLQQLTSERDVLRAAVSRLSYRPQNLNDTLRPGMTLFQALAIERDDAEVRRYFEDALLNDILAAQRRQNPQAALAAAERMTRSRASRLVHQSDAVVVQTLTALSRAVRSSLQVPGRKLFLFVSDGFLVNNQNPGIRDRLQQLTDNAVRAGAVVYTIQASGLNTTFPDASADVILVPGTGTGRLEGEDNALQDPLMELAADTGGKALLNANDLNQSLKRALRESNDYYLLSWRPENDNSGRQFHHVDVNVKGRPDLSVIVQRGFFDDGPKATITAPRIDKPSSSEASLVTELAAAIQGKLNIHALPTYVTANYLDTPNGASLSILVQVDSKRGSPPVNAGATNVDIAGVVYNESGKVDGSFVNTIKPDTAAGESRRITFLDQVNVKPGLYQVRVAARDSDGLTGTAMQWVKVPDLSSHRLALSSLLIGQRELTESESRNAAQFQKAQLKIDRRFAQGTRLRLFAFVYNASRGANNQPAHINAHVDIFRGNSAVISTSAFVIDTQNVEDPARIPYAGEVNLASLASGHYRIRVTVIDLNAKAFASQESSFQIE